MKRLLTNLAVASILLAGCAKSSVNPPSTAAALSFVNATVGSPPLIAHFSNNTKITYSTFSTSNRINYGGSNLYAPVSGTVGLSLVEATDTTQNLFSGNLNLQNNNVYSLYLTGTAASPDTVFIHENLPHYGVADSVAGIRFVNLSPGSSPISVDIQGQANGSEVASLTYKSHTAFKTYKADHTVTSYIFEFRDAGTGNLLATYTMSGVNNASSVSLTTTNAVRFHNQTLALIGQPAGGTVGQSVILVQNY